MTEPGQSNVPAASSLEKRAAQLLGGDDVPQKLLESVFRDGSPSCRNMLSSADQVGVLHLTLYDGCYIGDYIGEHCRGIQGDTRSLDYSPYVCIGIGILPAGSS